jgi:hypothetical protein
MSIINIHINTILWEINRICNFGEITRQNHDIRSVLIQAPNNERAFICGVVWPAFWWQTIHLFMQSHCIVRKNKSKYE